MVWYGLSRRAETIAADLKGQISYQYEVRLQGLWLTPLRYLVQGWKTWHFLEQERPDVVLVQAPPIFAPLVVAIWCRLRAKNVPSGRRVRFVIDGHTASFHHRQWRWSLPLLHSLSRQAIVTLVSDQAALNILQRWRVRGLFFIDGLPNLIPPTGAIGSEGEERVAVISVFDDNEPIEEVFAAARLLPQVTFYITGDPKHAPASLLAQKPENVILTGFLRGGNYTALLKNVHGLAVLTKEPNDLSCGAYEALAMAKPAVVSNGPEMRRFFTRGFIHVDNAPESIAAGIKQMLDGQTVLTNEVIATRSELTTRRQSMLEELMALLQE
jgi:glycosyltransferase involved in cell wall biosynthesis